MKKLEFKSYRASSPTFSQRMSDDDDDGLSESNRERPPLKKPRFVWQIQGRYSLRQERDDRGECSTSTAPSCHEAAAAAPSFHFGGSMPSSSSYYSRGECAMSRPTPRRCSSVFTWEYQASKAVFDNMLNLVIENGSFPQPEIDNIIDSYNRRIEPESSLSNNNHHLEDEAVRMAIRSHGLQKHCYMSLPPSQPQLHKHAAQSLPFRPSPSTSAKSLQLEQDLLSDAVSVAIQNKGLGTSFSLR